MNAPTLGDIRAAAAEREMQDEKMEQVRQLLFGDLAREVNTRMMLLEARLRELEVGVSRQLESISTRVDALAATADRDRRGSFDELARNIQELGERIAVMSRR
ncbi:MAG: hypothetical protein ACT4N2_05355 [Hyphomicrobium sp.]